MNSFFNVNIKEGHLDFSEFYDPARRQYNGIKLFMKLKIPSQQIHPRLSGYSMSIFSFLSLHIFSDRHFLTAGQGLLPTYRLSNERYGIKMDGGLVLERFKKEVIHELGHTFGLIHCHIPSCVMRSSTYVEDIDQKSMHLCLSCRNEYNINNSGNPETGQVLINSFFLDGELFFCNFIILITYRSSLHGSYPKYSRQNDERTPYVCLQGRCYK